MSWQGPQDTYKMLLLFFLGSVRGWGWGGERGKKTSHLMARPAFTCANDFQNMVTHVLRTTAYCSLFSSLSLSPFLSLSLSVPTLQPTTIVGFGTCLPNNSFSCLFCFAFFLMRPSCTCVNVPCSRYRVECYGDVHATTVRSLRFSCLQPLPHRGTTGSFSSTGSVLPQTEGSA